MNNKIYNLNPVNKISSLAISQSNCIDNIDVSDKEKLKILGQRQFIFSAKMSHIKKEMNLGKNYRNCKLPAHLTKHPKFQEMKELKVILRNIEKDIMRIKPKVKKLEYENFERMFIKMIQEEHYEIYKEVKDKIIYKITKKQEIDNEF